MMNQEQFDSFLAEVQVEERYDEQMLQEMNEYYQWLNEQYEKQNSQGGTEVVL